MVPLIVAPLLSRTLGASKLGEYGFSYSIVFYFLTFCNFGLTDYGTRIISIHRNDKEKTNKIFWSILTIKFFFFSLSAILYSILVFFLSRNGIVDFSISLALIFLLFSNSIDITFFYRGLEKFQILSISTIFVNILYALLIFIFVKTPSDVVFYTLLKSGILLIVNIPLYVFLPKKVGKPIFDKNELFISLKEGLSFFVPSLVMGLSPSIDQFFIGVFCDKIQVGFYQQVSKITALIFSIVYSISPVILANISFLYNDKEKNKELIHNRITKALLFAFSIAIPSVAGCFLISDVFIPLYFGEEFNSAIIVFKCLLPSSIFTSLSTVIISSCLFPQKKNSVVTKTILIGSFINACFTFTLIYFFQLGACGAAIATTLSGFCEFVFFLIYCKDSLYMKKETFLDILKIIISTLIMCLIIIIVNICFSPYIDSLYVIVFQVLIGFASFILCSIVLRVSIFFDYFKRITLKIFSKNK